MKLALVCRTLAFASVCVSASCAYAQNPAASPSPGPGTTVSLFEYRQLLRDYQETAGKKRALTPAETRDLSSRFSAAQVVSLPDGSRVTVNNQAELDALAAYTSNKPSREAPSKAVRSRAELLSLLSNAPQTGLTLKGDPSKVAQNVLATKEFANAASAKGDNSLWDKIMRGARWLSERIARFFDWLFGGRRSGFGKVIPGLARFVTYTLYVLLAVGALVGIYFLARLIIARSTGLQYKRKASSLQVDLTGADLPDPLGSARAAADAGDYRAAVRLVYIACLRKAAGTGLLVLQENRTNWEYQRALRGKSKIAYDVLLPATRLFDVVWYGNRSANAEAFDLVMKAHDALPTSAVPADTGPATDNKKPPTLSTTTPPGGNPW